MADDDTPPPGPLETKDLPAGFTPGHLPAPVPSADFTASAHPSGDRPAGSTENVDDTDSVESGSAPAAATPKRAPAKK